MAAADENVVAAEEVVAEPVPAQAVDQVAGSRPEREDLSNEPIDESLLIRVSSRPVCCLLSI
jgi:hypothetical protein